MDSKIPEFEPPTAAVARIIKGILPPNVMLTKDARAAFTRAAGIFIFYLTHCANDFSRERKRQTIFAQDIKDALRELDFEDFDAPLDDFLQLYKKAQDDAAKKKGEYKIASATEAGIEGEDNEMQIEGEDNEDGMEEQEDEEEEQEQEDEEEDMEEEDPEEEA